MELEQQSEFEGKDEHSAESREYSVKCIEHGAKRNAEDTESLLVDPTIPPDLRPEYCHYRDEGCELAESCLNCPFVRCIYDEPGGKQRWLKRLRAREISRLHTIEGKKVKELSEMFGVSERTVQRVLKSILGR